MPIQNNNPLTIPARPQLTADKLAVEKMTITRHGDKWEAVATVIMYAETPDGWVFARTDDGHLVTDTVSTQDVFATASTLPTVGAAVLAIQDAVTAMRDAKIAAAAAEGNPE